jgi:hypothetical protein
MVAAAAFTYKTKHDAEGKYREVRKLEAAIHYEEDTIDVLKADWSLLTQPARLQRLVETFGEQLKLQPVDPHQIVELSDLPVKELNVEQVIGDEVADAKGKDKIKTGSVKP